ncbi:MAG: tetratricopeptide repeat protein [Vicinamibacteria bacterium]
MRTGLLAAIAAVLLCAGAAPAAAAADEARRLLDAGQPVHALAQARASLADARAAGDAEAIARASLSLADVVLQFQSGGDDEVVALSRVAATWAESADDASLTTRSLIVTAGGLQNLGDDAAASAAAQRALAIQEALGEGSPDLADAVECSGSVALAVGDLKGARSRYERARRLLEAEARPRPADLGRVLNALAATQRRSGELESALALAELGLATRRSALPPGHPAIADSLNTLANIHFNARRLDAARATWEESLSLREAAYGPDHPLVAQSLNNLGAVSQALGQYSEARRLFGIALASRERTLGPDSVDVAPNLNTLAWVLLVWGVYGVAMPIYVGALAIGERALRGDHPDLAANLNNLAALYQALGDFPAARPLYERALSLRRSSLPARHPDLAQSLHNMGRLLEDMGELGPARELFEQALAIREELAPAGGHPSIAISLDALANLLRKSANPAEAERLLRRSVALREKGLGGEHPDVAEGLTRLGSLLRASGDPVAATPLLQRAVSIRRTALGPAHPLLARSELELARALEAAGRQAEAMAAALRAEAIAREHLRVTAGALAERQALAYASVRAAGLDLAVSLAGRRGVPAEIEQTWDAVVRSRALVLDEMMTRRRIAGVQADPALAETGTRLLQAREQLAALVVRGPGPEAPDRYRSRIEELRKGKERLERELGERSAGFRDVQDLRRASLADAAAALPGGSALIAYVRHGLPDGATAYSAFVMAGRGRTPRLFPLGAAEPIEAAVSRFRREMLMGLTVPTRTEADATAAARRAGEALRRLVWDPIAPEVAGALRLFLVPDGALNLVPFAALPRARQGFLLENRSTLHLLSAERDLAMPPAATGRGLLVVGDPGFDPGGSGVVRVAVEPTRGASACADFGALRFEPLPGTRRESEAISRVYARWRGRGQVLELRGAAATEAAVKAAAPGRRILHLATHGFFLGGRCESSVSQAEGVEDGRTAALADSPLLLSGLALAGANQRTRASSPVDDGILTAEEIAGLDLGSVEWAVLSACDTGVGTVRAGEGVFGFRRALLMAGARTSIMSLWPVTDEVTAGLMQRLYAHRLGEGLDTPDSLRRAQLDLLTARRAAGASEHPFFWAGFVAAGSWR